jgi:hypothetical protein
MIGQLARRMPNHGTPGRMGNRRFAASSSRTPRLCIVQRAESGPCAVVETPGDFPITSLPTQIT